MFNIFTSPFAAEMLWAGLAMTGLGLSGAVMPVTYRHGETPSDNARLDRLRSFDTSSRPRGINQ